MSRTLPVPGALTALADTVLDRTVVAGYSRIGCTVRRAWWAGDPVPGVLDGRTVAVTGANSGLGKATALGAARLGAAVVLLCRDVGRGESARAEMLDAVAGASVTVERCDLSDFASVRATAGRLRDRLPALSGLVHNAGVMPPRRELSPDGHELTVATHVLGPHLLTSELRPLLAAGIDPSVVFVSSGGMYTQRLRVDDPEYQRGDYDGVTAYARTKRMQVVLARLWSAQLADAGVAVHAMHPGWADTPGITDSLPRFAKLVGPILRDARQGADTAVWLLAAAEAANNSGRFWHDRRTRPTDYLPFTRHSGADELLLWDYCATATGAPVRASR